MFLALARTDGCDVQFPVEEIQQQEGAFVAYWITPGMGELTAEEEELSVRDVGMSIG